MLIVSSDISMQSHHWQPLSVHLWTYCTHPTHDVNDVWRLAALPGSTSPTLFEQRCGSFYVPQDPEKWKCCETGPTVTSSWTLRIPFNCLLNYLLTFCIIVTVFIFVNCCLCFIFALLTMTAVLFQAALEKMRWRELEETREKAAKLRSEGLASRNSAGVRPVTTLK